MCTGGTDSDVDSKFLWSPEVCPTTDSVWSQCQCAQKGDSATRLKTTYLTSVIVVCGAELLWCPVCVSVETDVMKLIIDMAKS